MQKGVGLQHKLDSLASLMQRQGHFEEERAARAARGVRWGAEEEKEEREGEGE
jgi:hypothetical protein